MVVTQGAAVRLVPSVGPDVLLQVGELGELALANLATVRLDPQVDSRVLRQIGAVGECFSTSCTLVWLRLPEMDLRVQLQVGLAVESLENDELGENVSQWKNRVEKMKMEKEVETVAGLRQMMTEEVELDLRTCPAPPAQLLLQ